MPLGDVTRLGLGVQWLLCAHSGGEGTDMQCVLLTTWPHAYHRLGSLPVGPRAPLTCYPLAHLIPVLDYACTMVAVLWYSNWLFTVVAAVQFQIYLRTYSYVCVCVCVCVYMCV